MKKIFVIKVLNVSPPICGGSYVNLTDGVFDFTKGTLATSFSSNAKAKAAIKMFFEKSPTSVAVLAIEGAFVADTN